MASDSLQRYPATFMSPRIALAITGFVCFLVFQVGHREIANEAVVLSALKLNESHDSAHINFRPRIECGNSICARGQICDNGKCSDCIADVDCPLKYKCADSLHFGTDPSSLTTPSKAWKRCIERDLVRDFSIAEFFCTLCVAVTAFLSAGSGVGGGGVFVPLFLLLLGFGAREAVPLSKACCLAGSVVNNGLFLRETHPHDRNRPKIDFDVVAILNPALLAGITVGVILHKMSPDWVVVILLLSTLIFAFQKSWTKGMQKWHQESAKLEKIERLGKETSPKMERLKPTTGAKRQVFEDESFEDDIDEVAIANEDDDEDDAIGNDDGSPIGGFRTKASKGRSGDILYSNLPGGSKEKPTKPDVGSAFKNRANSGIGSGFPSASSLDKLRTGEEGANLMRNTREQSGDSNGPSTVNGVQQQVMGAKAVSSSSPDANEVNLRTPRSSMNDELSRSGNTPRSRTGLMNQFKDLENGRGEVVDNDDDENNDNHDISSIIRTRKDTLVENVKHILSEYSFVLSLAIEPIKIILALCLVLFIIEITKAKRCTGLYWFQVFLNHTACIGFMYYSVKHLDLSRIGCDNGDNKDAICDGDRDNDHDEDQNERRNESNDDSGIGNSSSTSHKKGVANKRNGGFLQVNENDDELIKSKTSVTSNKGVDISHGLVTIYPFYSWVAGFVGGFLGIGGGMIISPVLMEFGLVPEVGQATTAMFVFLSSILAVLQFFILDMECLDYVFWYGGWVAISTYIGQKSIEYMLKIYKRTSLIILSVAVIIFLSMVMMTISGLWNLYIDVTEGRWEALQFSYEKFCH